MANIYPMPVVTFDRFLELAIVLPSTPIVKNGINVHTGVAYKPTDELVNMICYPEKMVTESLNLFACRYY